MQPLNNINPGELVVLTIPIAMFAKKKKLTPKKHDQQSCSTTYLIDHLKSENFKKKAWSTS